MESIPAHDQRRFRLGEGERAPDGLRRIARGQLAMSIERLEGDTDEDLAGRHPGRLKVVKVDVDANPGLAARFGAQSIPLLVVIRDGREVDRIVGALPRAALEQRLGPVLAS